MSNMAPLTDQSTGRTSTWLASSSGAHVRPVANYAAVSADTVVKAGKGVLYGIVCTSAGTMAAVYDNTAASGTVLIPSSALTAGQSVFFGPVGVAVNTGIYADWTSGSFLVLYA